MKLGDPMSDLCMNCVECQKMCGICYTCEVNFGGNMQPMPPIQSQQQIPQQFQQQQPFFRPQQQMSCKPPLNKFRSIPEKIQEITIWNSARCTNKCDYCFVYKLYPNQPNKDIEDQVIEALPNFIKKECVDKVNIWFFGGEPLVAFDRIQKIYDTVTNAGIECNWGITSNLVLMDEEKAKWLGNKRFSVLCSIDGTKESHDKHRKDDKGVGTWDRAWKGLGYVRRYVNNNPQIRWTIAPDTIDNLSESILEMISNGLTNLAIDPVYETTWTKEDIQKYSKEIEKVVDYLIENPNIAINIKPLNDLLPIITGGVSWESRCGLAQGGVGMDIYGNIYPCHRFVSSLSEDLRLGDVFNGIDQNKRLKFNEAYWKKGKPYNANKKRCNLCIFKNACIGCCLAVNYDISKDLNCVPDTFCDIVTTLTQNLLPKVMLIKDRLQNKLIAT